MSIPDNPTERIVILILGKEGKLSGKKIHHKALSGKQCSRSSVPKYPSSVYKAMEKLEEKGLIGKVEEKRVRGTVEVFYSLTVQGRKVFNELEDIFHILELGWEWPDFLQMTSACLKCEQNDVEECWKWLIEELELAIREIWDNFPFSRKPDQEIKQIFETPNHLREFIFLLRMLKLPKKRLEDKFTDQIRKLHLDIETNSN